MDEVDLLRLRIFPEDSVSLSPSSTTEPINLEDCHYAKLRCELEDDAQDLEAEFWSLAVDQDYLKDLSKEAIKRQDVIYELMQTEMHHVRTLRILLHVYMHELRESLQMEEGRLERLFPGLDVLLGLHFHFLCALKAHRQQSAEEGSPHNYQITQLGGILLDQFSGQLGEKMKECYGVFCYRHGDAISFYKDQNQNNKKFQNLMKKIGQLSIVRRLGIPECFLLVTQRITKYPVLVERILQNTEADTEEHSSLAQALALIRDSISQVDSQVSEYEKAARLKDIGLRLEPKSQGRLKSGRLFPRESLLDGTRTLLHEATATLKAASGRHKDIHAVLLTDLLFLLQEKDQKLVFSTVDNKPPVISLQRLIVREVANEDKAMFLLCASSNKPEMYEIHVGSRAERNAWMTLIRQAVESCPESEEEQEARAARLREFQEHLTRRDQVIVQTLTEKLQIFASYSQQAVPGVESPHTRLLLRGDASDLQQGETLLKGAITEVENLQKLQLSRMGGADLEEEEEEEGPGQSLLLRRAQTFGGFDTKPPVSPMKNGDVDETQSGGEDDTAENGQSLTTSDPEPYPEGPELSADDDTRVTDLEPSSLPLGEAEFFDRVLMLSQRLYSLQAVIAQQDSQVEVMRAWQWERERPAAAAAASVARLRSSDALLEQEKQRNLEKQREERQEQQRWEKERERHRLHAQLQEARLQEREEACRRLEERLAEERAAFEGLKEEYQRDLVRLREATQKVEREKEQLEVQQEKMKKQKAAVLPGALYMQASQSFRSVSVKEATDWAAGPASHGDASSGEVPPAVPPRKESMSPLPVKAEVPMNLVSTTNQTHKAGGVQQQIPTKLAALSKKQSKASKSQHRGSHQRTHSAASIDMSQVVPIKVTGKEGGSLRAKRSASPRKIHHTDGYNHRLASIVKPSQSFSTNTRSDDSLLPPPPPPPFPKEVLRKEKERVIFL